ncbi:MAG: hypothetical protein KDD45_15610 [Bdellovibrionales bacterium]|nr:hypothetical protein [Bdellovibrionales bacterium]
MASTVPGQRQIIDVGNFDLLVSQVDHYRSLEIANPVEIPRDFVELEAQLKQESDVLSSYEYNHNFIIPLIKHLNTRADAEEELSNRMEKTYISGTSTDFYSETSDYLFTDSVFLSSTRSDESDTSTTLGWRKGKSLFEIKLTDIEEDAIKAALLYIKVFSKRETSTVCRTTFVAQKMIINLYQDFIDCEISHEVQFCKQPPIAPLLSWGNGPATWTEAHTKSIGLKNVAIVNLPIGNSQGGIFAWTTLAHEVSGHDLLMAADLINELYQNVRDSLRSKGISQDTTNYWVSKVERIDEIASDILGVLNLGPAAAIGLIGYLKGLSPNKKLRPNGPKEDEHPADVLRGIAVANAVDRLAIQNRTQWSSLFYEKVVEDFPSTVNLDGKDISDQEAMRSAEIVSHAILNSFLPVLNGKSLRMVRTWGVKDQQVTEQIGACLSNKTLAGVPAYCKKSIDKQYAKHIIAAATIESLKMHADPQVIFSNMIKLLERA